MRKMREYAPLTPEQKQVVEQWLPLAYKTAHKVYRLFCNRRGSVDFGTWEDFEQEAVIVLCRCSRYYSPDHNTKFSTYLSFCIVRDLWQSAYSKTVIRTPDVREGSVCAKNPTNVEKAFNARNVKSLCVSFDNVQDRSGATDDDICLSVDVNRALQCLPERYQKVMKMRFWDYMGQKEIGQEMGVSKERISKMIRFSLKRLRRELEGCL